MRMEKLTDSSIHKFQSHLTLTLGTGRAWVVQRMVVWMIIQMHMKFEAITAYDKEVCYIGWNGRTDGRTDGKAKTIYPSTYFVCGGITESGTYLLFVELFTGAVPRDFCVPAVRRHSPREAFPVPQPSPEGSLPPTMIFFSMAASLCARASCSSLQTYRGGDDDACI